MNKKIKNKKVEDMMKRSFAESDAQKKVPLQKQLLEKANEKLAKLSEIECENCGSDLSSYCDFDIELMGIEKY